MKSSFAVRKENGDGYVGNVTAVLAPVEHKLSSTVEGVNTINETDSKFSGTSEAKIWIHATDENYAAESDSLTIKLYRGLNYVGEAVVSLVNVTAGNATPVSVSISNMEYCDKAIITGTVTVPTDGTVEVFLGKLGQV